jgi:hypothetical protein
MTADLLVQRPADVEAFLDRAGDFLAAHEAENNLLFGICSNLRANPGAFKEPARFAIVTEGDPADVVGAALQTPPHRLVLSHLPDVGVVDALADALADDPLPGVLGAPEAARRFAELWTSRTGGTFERRMSERIYRLSAVRPVEPAPGGMRIAEARDRPLIAAWLRAFADEALGETLEDADEAAERWVARRGRTIYFWDADGTTVSMSGAGGATPTGIRVGPVYTPFEHRGHGYATNLVASSSQAQLDAGYRFLFLFTDLANPTSNRIYRAIGYEPVTDVDQYVFRD